MKTLLIYDHLFDMNMKATIVLHTKNIVILDIPRDRTSSKLSLFGKCPSLSEMCICLHYYGSYQINALGM